MTVQLSADTNATDAKRVKREDKKSFLIGSLVAVVSVG